MSSKWYHPEEDLAKFGYKTSYDCKAIFFYAFYYPVEPIIEIPINFLRKIWEQKTPKTHLFLHFLFLIFVILQGKKNCCPVYDELKDTELQFPELIQKYTIFSAEDLTTPLETILGLVHELLCEFLCNLPNWLKMCLHFIRQQIPIIYLYFLVVVIKSLCLLTTLSQKLDDKWHKLLQPKSLLIAKVLVMFALCNNNFILKHHTCASSKFHQGKITPLSFLNVQIIFVTFWSTRNFKKEIMFV